MKKGGAPKTPRPVTHRQPKHRHIGKARAPHAGKGPATGTTGIGYGTDYGPNSTPGFPPP